MVKNKTWEEFRETGLLWLINQTLHLFGWAIVYEFNDDETVSNVYPARVKFRGFDNKNNSKGYIKVSEYLQENIRELVEESYD